MLDLVAVGDWPEHRAHGDLWSRSFRDRTSNTIVPRVLQPAGQGTLFAVYFLWLLCHAVGQQPLGSKQLICLMCTQT